MKRKQTNNTRTRDLLTTSKREKTSCHLDVAVVGGNSWLLNFLDSSFSFLYITHARRAERNNTPTGRAEGAHCSMQRPGFASRASFEPRGGNGWGSTPQWRSIVFLTIDLHFFKKKKPFFYLSFVVNVTSSVGIISDFIKKRRID